MTATSYLHDFLPPFPDGYRYQITGVDDHGNDVTVTPPDAASEHYARWIYRLAVMEAEAGDPIGTLIPTTGHYSIGRWLPGAPITLERQAIQEGA